MKGLSITTSDFAVGHEYPGHKPEAGRLNHVECQCDHCTAV